MEKKKKKMLFQYRDDGLTLKKLDFYFCICSAKVKIERARLRDPKGGFARKVNDNKDVNEEQVPVEDKEPQEMTVTSDVNFNNLLKWHDIVDKPARRTYTKTSRTTEWRRRKAKEALTAQGNQQIDQHFLIKDQQETADQSTESIDKQPKGPPIDKLAAIKLAHQDIIKEITPYTRIGPASRAKITIYELCKLSSVERFFRHRIAGDKKMKASEKASAEVWLNESTYRPALIRKYADEYIEFRSIKSP